MTQPSDVVLREACDQLSARDPVLASAYKEVDLPNWRTRPATYQTLAQIVVYQLISTKAADVIWGRILDRHKVLLPETVLKDDQQALQACGLSGPKLKHLNSIAEAVQTGRLDLNALASDPIETARKALVAVPGIGPWTAETFLMNAVGHLDAFPHGDVGLMEAHKLLAGLETRLSAKDFSKRAEAWQPFRAVAAHLLYDWLHLQRD